MKVDKSLSDVPVSQMKTGEKLDISWETLKPYISLAAGLSKSEFIKGITIDDDFGISVYVGRK